MKTPERHERYYSSYFYFDHWDITHYGGAEHTVDEVYELSNAYYKIVGIASRHEYGPDDSVSSSKVYTAIVKKDSAATYGYYLIAQKFNDSTSLKDLYTEYLLSDQWKTLENFSNDMNTENIVYVDLDSDGIEELLITAFDYPNGLGAAALLTSINGEIVCVMTAWQSSTSSINESLTIMVDTITNKPVLAKTSFVNGWGNYGPILSLYHYNKGTASEAIPLLDCEIYVDERDQFGWHGAEITYSVVVLPN